VKAETIRLLKPPIKIHKSGDYWIAWHPNENYSMKYRISTMELGVLVEGVRERWPGYPVLIET
jgi:hypothetical protein